MDYINSDQPEYSQINPLCFECCNVDQDIMTKSEDIQTEYGLTCGEVPCGEEWWCTKGHSLLNCNCPFFKGGE